MKAYYCHYLSKNFLKKTEKMLRFYFWVIAWIKTVKFFKIKIRKLWEIKLAVKDWL